VAALQKSLVPDTSSVLSFLTKTSASYEIHNVSKYLRQRTKNIFCQSCTVNNLRLGRRLHNEFRLNYVSNFTDFFSMTKNYGTATVYLCIDRLWGQQLSSMNNDGERFTVWLKHSLTVAVFISVQPYIVVAFHFHFHNIVYTHYAVYESGQQVECGCVKRQDPLQNSFRSEQMTMLVLCRNDCR